MNEIPQFDLLAKLLDTTNSRHHVIAQNIANVNTPNYRRLDLAFEDFFARAIHSPRTQHVADLQPRIVEAEGGVERPDGNNVDIDQEIGSLNKNALLFNTFTQILLSRLATTRSAITGR